MYFNENARKLSGMTPVEMENAEMERKYLELMSIYVLWGRRTL